MKNSYIIAAVLVLFFAASGCNQYYEIFGKKSTYFTPREEQILDMTAKALEFGWGYDPKLDLHYIFTYSFTVKDRNRLGTRLANSISEVSSEEFVAFFEKVYALNSLTETRMTHYATKRDMVNYTYLRKYLLPGITLYSSLLEAEVFKRDGSYLKKVYERKNEIREQMDEKAAADERRSSIDFD